MVRLTRRDALAALATVGTGGCVAAPRSEGAFARPIAVLEGAAEVLYPPQLEGHGEFVRTYVAGRIDGRESYREGVRAATRELDRRAHTWYGGSFVDLDRSTRESVLRESGGDTAEADPGGSFAERLRYYVIEELLYALYASPAGGRLAGIENPVGYPGGTESYTRGPDR